MYIENDKFGEWMQKLYAKLEELCKQIIKLTKRYEKEYLNKKE